MGEGEVVATAEEKRAVGLSEGKVERIPVGTEQSEKRKHHISRWERRRKKEKMGFPNAVPRESMVEKGGKGDDQKRRNGY